MNRPILIAWLVVATSLMGLSMEPPKTRYQLNDESRFWIDGSATTGAFSCLAEDVSGNALLDSDRVQAGLGWFITPNILTKLEYVSQRCHDFPADDLRAGGRVSGFMVEAVVSF